MNRFSKYIEQGEKLAMQCAWRYAFIKEQRKMNLGIFLKIVDK